MSSLLYNPFGFCKWGICMLSQSRISEELCCYKARKTGSSSIIHSQTDMHMLPFFLTFTVACVASVCYTIYGICLKAIANPVALGQNGTLMVSWADVFCSTGFLLFPQIYVFQGELSNLKLENANGEGGYISCNCVLLEKYFSLPILFLP